MLFNPGEECHRLVRLGVTPRRKANVERDQFIWLESRIDRLKPLQATHEQSSAHQQYDGQCDLHDHQRGTECAARSPGSTTGVTLFQSIARVGAGGLPCREQSEKDSHRNGDDERKSEHAQVKIDFVNSPNVGWQHAFEHGHAPPRGRDAHSRGNHAEQCRLGDELTRQASAACAQSSAYGNLTRPACAACQQQVREIGASNQQHHCHRRHKKDKWPALVSDNYFVETLKADAPRAIFLGIVFHQTRLRRLHCSLCLRQRHARLKTADDPQIMAASPFEQSRKE